MNPTCRSGTAREADRYHSPPDSKSVMLTRGVAWAIVLSMVGGCAANVDQLRSASKREPTNAQVQLKYVDERDRQVNALLDEADRLRAAHAFDQATQMLEQAGRIDPTSERGKRIAPAIDV